jgi:hypothetical protein
MRELPGRGVHCHNIRFGVRDMLRSFFLSEWGDGMYAVRRRFAITGRRECMHVMYRRTVLLDRREVMLRL